MPINRTAEFKRVVKEHGPIDTKRRKVAQPEGKDVFDKEYLKEGYVVVSAYLCSMVFTKSSQA